MNWQSLAVDLRYAARLVRRSPVFSSVAVFALALGIGANTAIFTVVRGVLLTPLPYVNPDRLVMIWSTNGTGGGHLPVAPLDAVDYRSAASSFSALEDTTSFVAGVSLINASGAAEQITVTSVSPGMFEMLGRSPVVGRVFTAADPATSLVISHAFWQRRLGGDPNVIGRALNIQGQPSVVLGVMPADFVFPYRSMLAQNTATRSTAVDAWGPLQFAANPPPQSPAVPLTRAARFISVVGRLKPGVSAAQASDDVGRIARQLSIAHPDTNRTIGATVVPLHEQTIGAVRPALLLLFFGVGFVLLMACINLTNMLLARSLARQREMAIRSALGAGRRRLMRQTLFETTLLSVAGGTVALAAVRWGIQLLVAAAPSTLPRLADVHADATVLLFTFALSLVTGLTIGAAPAIVASRPDLQHALKDGGRGASHGRAHRRFRSALIVCQVALALVLTLGSGLLLRSFLSVLSIDPGFRADHALTLQLALPPRYQTPDQLRAFYASLLSRLSSLPGVTAVGGTTRLPLASTTVTTKVAVDGTTAPVGTWPEIEFRRAVYDYFAAMNIPLLRGRTFTSADGPASPRVVVINETMARQLFAGQDPVGRRLKLGSPAAAPVTIVGVIGDLRHVGLETPPAPELYTYYLQNPPVNPFLVLRTSNEPGALASVVRSEVQAVDKEVPVYDIRPMEQVRSDALSQRRFVLLLVTAFGGVALVMAAAGVYGVMTLTVTERQQEIGIRLALGAHPSSVVRAVVGEGVTFAALGIGAGFAMSLAAAPLVASQLFGVTLLDAPTLAAVPSLLLLVAALSCYLPARRAIAIDPVDALRN
jgi:putative ABC transport system permease protein